AAQRADDTHPQITDAIDLADITAGRPADEQATRPDPHPDAAGTALPDIRDTAAPEPPQRGEDAVRVPSADETADAIARAQRALAEIEQRRLHDERAAAPEAPAHQLAPWHPAARP